MLVISELDGRREERRDGAGQGLLLYIYPCVTITLLPGTGTMWRRASTDQHTMEPCQGRKLQRQVVMLLLCPGTCRVVVHVGRRGFPLPGSGFALHVERARHPPARQRGGRAPRGQGRGSLRGAMAARWE